MDRAVFVSHSYGSLVAARAVKLRPEAVEALCFIDPACFLMCLPVRGSRSRWRPLERCSLVE